MWQIANELEAKREQREAEERRKASTPVAVLNIRTEGGHQLCELTLLIPSTSPDSKLDAGGFREVKVRGPRRKLRAEAMKDGFDLRAGFHSAGEAEVRKRQRELHTKVWEQGELPASNAAIETKEDYEQRLRLAQRPRGTGWSRQKDAEFFVHTSSPMAYDPKKMQYFVEDGSHYVACAPPHDPTEYPITVGAGASLVGGTDDDLLLPDRPRTLLLKELVKTGAAMKKPLFFLDQPACCFVLMEGHRGSAAVDYCSKNFHTKLLAKLSSSLQFWSEAMVEALLTSICEELDAELLQQPNTCYDGVSLGVAILLGDRLTVATLGAVRGLLVSPGDGPGNIVELGNRHRVTDGPERQRIDAVCGEVTQDTLRRPLRLRRTAVLPDQAGEIQRVLDCAPDSFAALGLDTVDVKAAKAQYRKLALKVHPDKAPEELKARAKEAFAKIEAAAERIEILCETDAEATSVLHRILESAGDTSSAVMPRSWAYAVLGVDEGSALEDAELKAVEFKKTLLKLGQFADGTFAHPDTIRAGQLLDEALEVLVAPPRDALEPVTVTRALGLRDLKKPRPIVSAVPQIDVVQLDRVGNHHLALLSSLTSSLSDDEILERIRCFPRQPKAASLVIAQDAAMVHVERGAPRCLASSVVGVFEVAEERAEEPASKRQRTEPDKVRCLHILMKHKDLKLTKDVDSQLRMKGRSPVVRSAAMAERELLQLQRALAANPNIFHVLARKHSECDTAMQPGQNAGDLGWVTRGTSANPHFEAVMFSLKIYEVSDIVVTPRGFHIIQRIA